ncbi:paralemmin-3 [Canis lupus familiaris]|uniref:Paralemmin 3 n=2 Tax=Canis lupus familiaris TaxID=9615 RepID=A0A8I3PK01_CANLF|nr:paralemmin-3 [Canis lupus familiaris]
MALQSQMWSLAAPMPMAESSLYRQRLEVIAEKRRLQEEIRAARRELEEEKLRVERLKRKSLRERWLMDGAAEGPEQQEDPQSPEGQAQARIRNLEDSLFTLQSQLQLLQSASTGAQHKSSGRPTWRRQGHRPFSQPTVETDPTDYADLNKRASLPAGLVDASPEAPSEPRDETGRAPPALRLSPGAAGVSSEANGPCAGPSLPPEQEPRQGLAASEGGVGEAKGGVVKVVWERLRATEDCATEATGPELEAKVEEMVMEAIGDRQEAGCPERPSWVREDRGVVEVVWEGVGGPESSHSEATGEAGRGLKAAQISSPSLQVRPEGAAPGEGVPRGSPDGDGPGGSGGEEGSFIWVEKVTLSEEWEELVVEGSEGPRVWGRRGGPESPLGVERGVGEEAWESGSSRVEGPVGAGRSEGKVGAEQEGAGREGSEDSPEPERRGDEEKLGLEREAVEERLAAPGKAVEGPWRAERERGEEPPPAEQKGERGLDAEEEHEEPLGGEQEGDEEKLEATEEPLVMERKEGEESLEAEKTGGEKPLEAERGGGESLKAEKGGEASLEAERGGEAPLEAEGTGGEEPLGAEKGGGETPLEAKKGGGEESLEAEKTEAVKEDLSPEEQGESGGGQECQAEEVSEAGASLGAKEDSRPEKEEPQPQEKQEGSLEEESARPRTPVESQGPSGDPTPLLAETPAPEQPAECQPLLQAEGPRANPRARPVPTYAPARQPEPSAPPEGEEASGPKQKTCQCCAVM